MRLPGSEKLEIIRLVEQSHLPARRTLEMLSITSTVGLCLIESRIGTLDELVGARRTRSLSHLSGCAEQPNFRPWQIGCKCDPSAEETTDRIATTSGRGCR